MEQKTNPSDQQAATKKEPTAWLQEVSNMASAIGEQLNDKADNRRAFIVIAVERTGDEGNDAQALIGLSGNSVALAIAMKQVLTGNAFAPHIAHAAQMMASEAAAQGKGTIVIHAGDFDEDDEQAGDDNQETEQSQEGD